MKRTLNTSSRAIKLGNSRNNSLSELAKTRVTDRRRITETITSAGNAFLLACSTVNTSDIVNASTEWGNTLCELFLLGKLGVKGLEALRYAYKILPKELGNLSSQYATQIINSLESKVTDEDTSWMLEFLEKRCPR